MTLALKQIVLASGSEARRQMLEAAGLDVLVDPANVDEKQIRKALLSGDDDIDPGDLAEVLARAKADRVSGRRPSEIVVAADQILSCEDEILSKPSTIAEAQTQILGLRGKTHTLHSAVVIAVDQEVTWAVTDTADITFRDCSPAFVGQYIAAVGSTATQSPGGYHLEGPGIQLVESVRGDYFTVLGLPMFELLAELRKMGALKS